jgi:Cell Wall Hydrolase
MVASRTWLAGGFSSTGFFWLSAFCAALMPTSIGYQDLAAQFARQPGVAQRWREHLIASPFGTIDAATFSYGRPIGTTMPQPPGYQLVNFDPGSVDAKAWSIDEPLTARPAAEIAYPTVNRRLKGDRLPSSNRAPAPAEPQSLPQLQPIDAPPASQPVRPLAPPATPRPRDAEAPDAAPPAAQMDVVNDAAAAAMPAGPRNHDDGNLAQSRPVSPPERDNAGAAVVDDDIADGPPEIPAAVESGSPERQSSSLASLSFHDEDAENRSAQIYFGAGVMGSPSGIKPWAPGAEPVMATPSVDSGIKLAALEGTTDDGPGGETVAGKDDASRLKSPAQRLGLAGKARAKAEKCLADAVYFEARGEPLKGQEAVAQVVMNRVFSGYYPSNVCGVVYQNASHYLACQFTFACEGKDLSRIDEPDMWAQAKRIARDTLDGKIWLADIGHATHYHAYWVHPSWVHEMTRLHKLGVHTFYRPRAWGKGNDEPVWGPAAKTSQVDGDAAKPQAATMSSEAVAKAPDAGVLLPAPAAAQSETTAKL